MSKRGIALVGAVVYLVVATPEPQEPQPQPQLMPELVIIEPVERGEAVPEEDQTPLREDIPLDEETQMLLYEACTEKGVPYELALAIVHQETNFRNIIGDDGASTGYMQVQRRWHEDRMERLGVTDLADPYGNFLVGCDYLAELLGKERGTEWALMAYNGGPTYANEMAKAGKTSQYAKDALNYMNNLEEFEYGNMEF